jgi:hypothetical protein
MRPEDFMPRLAFIRYLYTNGVEQSPQPLPMGASSVLTLHDSVEMFLQLAAEHTNAGADKRTDFDKYFVLINQVLPATKLFGKASMLRLNTARVGLKHHGILPAQQDIESFRSSVTTFFEDNTPLVFDIDFKNISMVDLVQSANAQASLREATDLMANGQYDGALPKIALAFNHLTRDYERSKRGRRRYSPFYFEHQSLLDESFTGSVKESIEALQNAVRILCLGLNYRRFTKFDWLTPRVYWMYGGNVQVNPPPHPPVTEEDCRFCFDFVIEAAIQLQEFDYELEDPWREQMRQVQAAQAQQEGATGQEEQQTGIS